MTNNLTKLFKTEDVALEQVVVYHQWRFQIISLQQTLLVFEYNI